jgi:hypothetical protein
LSALGILQPKGETLFAGWLFKVQVQCMAGEYHMYQNFIRWTLTATILCGIATAVANAQTTSTANSDVRSAYLESFGQLPNASVLQVLASLFQQFDRAGDGIDAADIDYSEKQQAAQVHSNIAAQWLRMDINADLKISREEVEGSLGRFRMRNGILTKDQKKRMDEELKKQVDVSFQVDADHNGIIEGIELYTPQQNRNNDSDYIDKNIAFVKALLKADPNGDGKVTQTEAGFIASQSLD